MLCPECKAIFTGNAFCRDVPGKWRKCPNGHVFKEPPRQRTSPEKRKLDEVRQWAEEAANNSHKHDYCECAMHVLALIDNI